ncbi:hypothetical protein [Ancylobacter polymorphus]|uniref:Serine kinase n=1 Tax=Ancylobacter polymorphus TaxID=223390 RepID=A0ABU0BHI0_9HYPH|nr:hypothetical protein [Ancylobacter polymorphus]MDQ0304507.1 hypothetical protein [Ancylobacter polymorphus]
MIDYVLSGLLVRSEIDLFGPLPWTGECRSPDVVITLGTVPPELSEPISMGRFVQIGADGSVRLEVDGVATYFVARGRDVIVCPHRSADENMIGVYLLGSVFGFLCHQRGLLPLHASCLSRDNCAVALAGPSGAGKSTLAAAMIAEGWNLLADDVTVLDLSDPKGAIVLPSFPRVKLWQDSIDAVDLVPRRLLYRENDREKFECCPDPATFQPGPVRLSAVYHLRKGELGMVTPLRQLDSIDAVHRIRMAIYRLRVLLLMAGPESVFQRAVILAGSCPQYTLQRPPEMIGLRAYVSSLSDQLRAELARAS